MSTSGPNLMKVSANFCLVIEELKLPTYSLDISLYKVVLTFYKLRTTVLVIFLVS